VTGAPARLRPLPRWAGALRRAANRVLRRYNLRLVRRSHWRDAQQTGRALAALAEHWAARAPPVTGWDASGIVFSRERPLQLEALLRSYLRHCRPAPPLAVLYRARAPAYAAAYAELAARYAHAPVSWHPERDFAADLRALIRAAGTHGLFFLVDDQVFIRPVDFALLGRYPLERYVPALRAGRNVTASYFADRPCVQPALREEADGLLTWSFAGTRGEWAPLSVDGDVHVRAELEAMAHAVEFRAPNSLELALSAMFRGVFEHRRGVCFAHSRVVNVPLNRVQHEFDNRAGTLGPEVLLEYWQRGLRMDVQALEGAATSGMHQELAVRFVGAT
jgi:hypothetical protein